MYTASIENDWRLFSDTKVNLVNINILTIKKPPDRQLITISLFYFLER